MVDPFRDRVVVITGSTRGFGRAAASALAQAGAWVVVNGRRASDVRKLVGEIRHRGGHAEGVAADVATAPGVRRLLEVALATGNGIDIWINNAGLGGVAGPLWHGRADEQTALLRTNLEAVLLCSREVCRWAVAQRAQPWLVNISSGAGERAMAGAAAYVASKHGIEGLTKALAVDTAGTGITVTALKLPALRTDMTRPHLSTREHARLPLPKTLVPALLELLRAEPSAVHGRSFAAWRLLGSARAELVLNSPAIDAGAIGIWSTRRAGLTAPAGALRLDRMENPYGPPPAAGAALVAQAAGDSSSRYPDEHQSSLRAALSSRCGCQPIDLSLGPGASELVERVLRLFVKPGEAVVCHAPTWFMFDRMCTAAGIEQRAVPIQVDLDRGQVDFGLQAILDQVRSGGRLVYLVNPSNPLGAAWPAAQLIDLVRSMPPTVPLVVDEAYAEFAEGGDSLLAPALLQHGRDRTLIVLRTLSKFYGLAGLRVGYAMASNTLTAALLSTLEAPYNIATASAAAATAAIGDAGHAGRVRAGVQQEKQRWYRWLERTGLRFVRSDACFLYTELPLPANDFLDAMERRAIFLPRAVYGERCAVLPIAMPEQNERIWAAMTEVLAPYQ